MNRRKFLVAAGLVLAAVSKAFGGNRRSTPMKKQVQTDKAPKAIGPYSQGIIANGFVFCSGQIPIDPATGDLNTGTIEDADPPGPQEPRGRPRGRRLVARRGRQDHGLPPGHERFRQDERGLRRVLQSPQPGPGRGPGRPAAARRQGRDRGHRPRQVMPIYEFVCRTCGKSVRAPRSSGKGKGRRLRCVRIGGRPEDDLLFRHRRRLEPDQGVVLELHELFEQVLQHLPLRTARP